MNALPPERAWRVASLWSGFARKLSLQRADRLPYRSAPQGRLAQRDEMLERKAGDPPLPVTDGVEPPDRVSGRLGVELMIATRQVTARRPRRSR